MTLGHRSQATWCNESAESLWFPVSVKERLGSLLDRTDQSKYSRHSCLQQCSNQQIQFLVPFPSSHLCTHGFRRWTFISLGQFQICIFGKISATFFENNSDLPRTEASASSALYATQTTLLHYSFTTAGKPE